MTRQKTSLMAGRQRGIGLIEVMISLAIGLVLLGALAYFFLGSQQMNRTHDDVSRMQESGRSAMEVLGNAIRQAGYRVDIIADEDVGFKGVALNGTDGASGAPDTVTVQYDAKQGGEVDCVGTNIASGLVTIAFAVNGNQQLTCNGTVVVDNIENMQITYGIDTNKDGTIESYKASPSTEEFGQVPDVVNEETRGRVAAVRVSLLVRGPSPNTAANRRQTYRYNGADVIATDGFLRQVYTSTFTVRSQAR